MNNHDDDGFGSGAFGGGGPFSRAMSRGPTPQEAEVLRLRDQVTRLGKAIEQIKDLPLQLANVVRVHKEGARTFVTLSHPIGHVTDARVEPKVAEDLEPGDFVWQAGSPGQSSGIVSKAPSIPHLGVTAQVRQIIGETALEIDGPGGGRSVAWSKKRFPDVKVGGTVLIDRGGCVVVGALGKSGSSEYAFETDTGVTWADIGGLEEAKRTLVEAVELPAKHPELFAAYGKRPTKGVLLEGPPRCGKTMLAKAVASSLRTQGGGGGFFYLRGPEVLDKFVGVAEARVREVFAAARAYKEACGRPAVIFLDEADALLTARGSKGPYAHVEQTMVPQFLAEMDGLETSGAIVLLATNRASQLDPAVLGHGRIDRTIYVPRPTQKVAEEIFGLTLEGVPLSGPRPNVAEAGPNAEAFEVAAARDLFADSAVIKEVRLQGATITLRLRDVVNGAMIVAVVETAKARALRRDLEAVMKGGSTLVRRAPVATGIRYEDIEEAIKLIATEEKNKNHSDELVALAPAALKEAAAEATKPVIWAPGAR